MASLLKMLKLYIITDKGLTTTSLIEPQRKFQYVLNISFKYTGNDFPPIVYNVTELF